MKRKEVVSQTTFDGVIRDIEKKGGIELKDLDDIRNYVSMVLGLPCELIGNWLWVTDFDSKTFPRLKEIGFKFSPEKNAFFYHNKNYVKKTGRTYSIEEIRKFYNNPGIIVKGGK